MTKGSEEPRSSTWMRSEEESRVWRRKRKKKCDMHCERFAEQALHQTKIASEAPLSLPHCQPSPDTLPLPKLKPPNSVFPLFSRHDLEAYGVGLISFAFRLGAQVVLFLSPLASFSSIPISQTRLHSPFPVAAELVIEMTAEFGCFPVVRSGKQHAMVCWTAVV